MVRTDHIKLFSAKNFTLPKSQSIREAKIGHMAHLIGQISTLSRILFKNKFIVLAPVSIAVILLIICKSFQPMPANICLIRLFLASF